MKRLNIVADRVVSIFGPPLDFVTSIALLFPTLATAIALCVWPLLLCIYGNCNGWFPPGFAYLVVGIPSTVLWLAIVFAVAMRIGGHREKPGDGVEPGT